MRPGREGRVLAYVDDQVFETRLQPENTVRELVDEVRAGLSRTERLVMGIRADGLDITGDGYADALGKPLASFDRYDFTTGDPRRVAGDALAECRDLLADADARRAETVDLLTQGDVDAGVAGLGECCRSWQQVHQAVCNAIALLKLDPNALELPQGSLTTVLSGAREELSQVHEALRARDFVLVSDILQYEFDPIVANWRAAIDVILETTGCTPQCP